MNDRPQKNPQVNVGSLERRISLLGGVALTARGMKSLRNHHVMPGLALITAGSLLAYRGKTGYCALYHRLGIDTSGETGISIERSVTIGKSPREVYDVWRKIENLPHFMQHLDRVDPTGEKTSHWKASGPGGITIEWDAELIEDRPGERLSWRSVDGSDVDNAGSVDFKEAPGGRGTEIKVHITYRPPGGTAGVVAGKMANFINAQQIEEDLKRFKQVLETGEIATAAMR